MILTNSVNDKILGSNIGSDALTFLGVGGGDFRQMRSPLVK